MTTNGADHLPRWRFLVDENLPRSLASDLRTAGYEAEHVTAIGLAGAPDPDVFAHAQTHDEALITGDWEFAGLRVYPPPQHGLIIVEAPNTMLVDARKAVILRGLASLAGQSLAGALIIVRADRVRVRH